MNVLYALMSQDGERVLVSDPYRGNHIQPVADVMGFEPTNDDVQTEKETGEPLTRAELVDNYLDGHMSTVILFTEHRFAEAVGGAEGPYNEILIPVLYAPVGATA